MMAFVDVGGMPRFLCMWGFVAPDLNIFCDWAAVAVSTSGDSPVGAVI